jgi:hypothetical protein
MEEYLERIIKYTKIEESTIIIILLYLDRLAELSEIKLSDFNIHRFIVIFIILKLDYSLQQLF